MNKRYGVDVFACVTPYNEEFKEKTLRWVVLLDSIVKDKDFENQRFADKALPDVELEYTNLNKMLNIVKLSNNEKSAKLLEGLEIHNAAQELKKEITFLVLFKSVNSLIKIEGINEEFINDVYHRIKIMNNLTDSGKQHFDSQRERYKNEMTNA
ncbi:MAG: hypothetical protein EZS28_040252, partial [Streblomastix strix]